VIPTRNRPEFVCRAVRSALNQTYANLEVVVVVDGPDSSTVKALEQLNEPRVRVVALEENVGGGEARNIGAHEAKGEWIALLDDDDEWFSEKIQRQIVIANALQDKNSFVSCRFIDRSIGADRISPLRMPDPQERIDEYFFCSKGYRTGEGFLQTSTLLIHRELILRIPFEPRLKRGQECSWMIMACVLGHAAYYVAPDVLCVFNSEGHDLLRVSAHPKWRSFYQWMQANKACLTPRAYSFCIATSLLPDAIKCNEPFAVKLRLLWDCLRHGDPTAKCIFKFIYAMLVPLSMRLVFNAKLRPVTKGCGPTESYSGHSEGVEG
jgi:glycosyltransferase involved in cell wall biosynthesis